MHEADLATLPERALNSSGDGVLGFDLHWRFTYVSDGAEKLMGRPRGQLLGRNLWDLYPDLIESPFGTAYLHAMTDGMPIQVESFYAPFEAWYEVRAFPSSTGIFAFTRDITARKLAEASLLSASSTAEVSHVSSASTASGQAPGGSAPDETMANLSRDSLRSIIRLSHCIEDELGAKMTTQALQDMALLRGCVTRLRNASRGANPRGGLEPDGARHAHEFDPLPPSQR